MKDLVNVGVVILAAGRGTRLNSIDRPKVMQNIGGRPIVSYVVETLEQIGFTPEQICLVVGFKKELIYKYFGERVQYAHQAEQLGTAHAAYLGMRQLASDLTTVLVLGGDDSAFYSAGTLSEFIRQHQVAGAAVSLLTVESEDPWLLGRVIRDADGAVTQVLEKEELNEEQKKISEVSTGTYCFNRAWFKKIFPALPAIGQLNEYGLPKTIELARRQGKKIQTVKLKNPSEWFGVNTAAELAEADRRKTAQAMK